MRKRLAAHTVCARAGYAIFFFGTLLTRWGVHSRVCGPAHPVDGSRPHRWDRRTFFNGKSDIWGQGARLPADLFARTPHATARRGRLEKNSSALPPTLAGAGTTQELGRWSGSPMGAVAASVWPDGRDCRGRVGARLVVARVSWRARTRQLRAVEASLLTSLVSGPAIGVSGCWEMRVVTLGVEGAPCIARSDASADLLVAVCL